MLLRIVGLVLFVLVVSFYSFKSKYISWVTEGEKDVLKVVELKTDLRKLDSLPLPLQNYLKKSLGSENLATPKYSAVSFKQRGLFWLKNEGEGLNFKAQQVVSLQQKEFSWFAKIRMGIAIYVTDRLVGNTGALKASALGVFPIADASGENIYQGQVLRYLAELPWYPMAILLDHDIEWSSLSENKVQAQIMVLGQKLKVEYTFNSENLIEKIYTEDREYSEIKQKRPWVGEFSKYQSKKGILIPSHGEVSWILGSDKFTYFKGDIEEYSLNTL